MAIIQTVDQAVERIEHGMKVMVGGFLGIGTPLNMVDAIAERNTRDLTLISVVAGYPGGNHDLGKLTANKQIKKFIGAHIGTDPKISEQYNNGELELELIPMGTWTEQIRAGGSGLGAVVTKTGLGTEVEEGRKKITLDGQEYLLFPPLKADVAIIKAHKADRAGNLLYRGTSINSNQIMATAAELVIAEVDEIVEIGDIDYNHVGTPGIFVDIIVQGNTLEERKEIFENLWTETNRL